MRGKTIPAGGKTVWGFSLTQAFIASAILTLAASVFLPAFKVQCAAAQRGLAEVPTEMVQAPPENATAP